MSATLPPIEHLNFDAFIAAFGEKDTRYEMYNGEVFAMAGGSRNHSLVSIAALTALRQRALARGCETHGPDLYVRPDDDDKSAMSPDAYVRCGPPPPDDQRYITDPVIIIEVLSPSTMDFDRGEKRRRYCKFNSLQHCVIIYPDAYRAEMWTRPPEGATQTDINGDLVWTHNVANGLASSLTIEALGDAIGLAEFYDGVTLAA